MSSKCVYDAVIKVGDEFDGRDGKKQRKSRNIGAGFVSDQFNGDLPEYISVKLEDEHGSHWLSLYKRKPKDTQPEPPESPAEDPSVPF